MVFLPSGKTAVLLTYVLSGLAVPVWTAPRILAAHFKEGHQASIHAAEESERIRIRVGLPLVVRGPGSGIPDNPLSEIQLSNGRFRAFSANMTTYAIDGTAPWVLGGKPRAVLKPAGLGKFGESGEWINHVERSGATLLGWVHDETGDAPGMGLKSMSLAVSSDDGLSWRRLGQIITGAEGIQKGRVTGVGDCTAVDGEDGYYYAYCLSNFPDAIIAARAPVSDPGPGHWKKYFKGEWSEPGLSGNATGLQTGVATARWKTTGETVNVGSIPGGLGVFLSTDHVNFTQLGAPLLQEDNPDWNRRGAAPELIAYADLLDAKTGGNQLSDQWLLAYLYIQPNEGFDKRYLVMRQIEVSPLRQKDEPQVGVMLAHWYNARLHDHQSTVEAVPGNYASYKLVEQSGYLLTAADTGRATTELEECVSQWPGHADHILIEKGVCQAHGYKRLRSAGFVFREREPGTQPLYRCYSEQEKSHFAANSEECDHMGRKEELLGYDLAK